MSKYCESPAENNGSKYNLSFRCESCGKKYHLKLMMRQDPPTCQFCLPPSLVQSDIIKYAHIEKMYKSDEIKSLLKQLMSVLEGIKIE